MLCGARTHDPEVVTGPETKSPGGGNLRQLSHLDSPVTLLPTEEEPETWVMCVPEVTP